MNTTKLDYLNIALMIISCILAFLFPFELFLFSYAVLGPLHYLTEIPWLHQRSYFSRDKKDYIWLVVFCAILSLGVLWTEITYVHSVFTVGFSKQSIENLYHQFIQYFPTIVFVSLGWAMGMALTRKKQTKFVLLILFIALSLQFQNTQIYKLWVGVMIPTLVHVYVFTGLFILYGALRNKSFSGLISLVVFLLCGVSFFYLPFFQSVYPISEYVTNAMVKSGFLSVNEDAISIFKNNLLSSKDHYESKYIVQRFIAFAYTYHYLNWFSKTGIIKWHKVPIRWLLPAILIWICSLILYAYDYRVGLMVLFFLSMLHVFLEFPLNFKTTFAILEEIKKLLWPKFSKNFSSK